MGCSTLCLLAGRRVDYDGKEGLRGSPHRGCCDNSIDLSSLRLEGVGATATTTSLTYCSNFLVIHLVPFY
ncbi:unnamed protein product [Caretta caretta]